MNDCQQCDGEGRIWNNADPTSGQWVECECAGLLPCPFCGGEAEIERIGNARQSTIYACTSCGCRLETGETFNHGVAWNTRSEAAAVGGR